MLLAEFPIQYLYQESSHDFWLSNNREIHLQLLHRGILQRTPALSCNAHDVLQLRTQDIKNCLFFPTVVSFAVLWIPSHECPGYYKSHAHMSSASMVSCLLSVCYLVLSVPIIFKLALDWFQNLQYYSWKLLVEAFQSVRARGWNNAGLGRGKVWGLGFVGGKGRGGLHLCVCQFTSLRVRVSRSGWKEFCVRRKMWSTDMWKEGNCPPRQQSSGELPVRLSPLSALITDQFITMSAFPNK